MMAVVCVWQELWVNQASQVHRALQVLEILVLPDLLESLDLPDPPDPLVIQVLLAAPGSSEQLAVLEFLE